MWPAPSWLHSSVGRALHRCHRAHGFKSCSGLSFFQALISQLLIIISCVYKCDDPSCLHFISLIAIFQLKLVISTMMFRLPLQVKNFLIWKVRPHLQLFLITVNNQTQVPKHRHHHTRYPNQIRITEFTIKIILKVISGLLARNWKVEIHPKCAT